ncbi:hypothetical protein E2C01_089794 [Portunus trituberculatus]|uniref:Uncharacterized protein n=1 Tax=Portunus trituberculatus TaxID=210409 RepID=A0A5B7JNF0_PORTR|nr:hypothetical protein [Portunus trituberculatus]
MRHEKRGAPTYWPAAELSGAQFEIVSGTQFENAVGPNHLEFRLDENTFQMYVRDIEKELNCEQNSYNKNENVEAIRRRHEEFFAENLITRIEELLDNMDVSSQEFLKKVNRSSESKC